MKALFISPNSNLHNEVFAFGASRKPPVEIISVRGDLQDAAKAVATEMPQLLILDAAAASVAALEKLETQYPQTALMLLTADQSPATLLRAMRAGVREVLPLPLDRSAFDEAMDRVAQKFEASIRNGKVVSFIPCKGGSGATFLAANLGHALAAQTGKKVLLIDLNRQFGDAVLYVSEKKPTMTLSDICAQIGRVDPGFLESSLVGITPNFGVLAASDDPTHSADILPEHVDTVLRLARTYYDFVILDMGRQIDAVTIRALDHSDLIYPVLQLTMPHIRGASRLLAIFSSLGYGRNKARLIVNRYEKRGELRLLDLVNALGGAQVHTMPNNYKAASDSINQGVPVLQLAGNSAISRSLLELADQLAERSSPRENGLIMRLFNNRVQASIANG